MVKQARSGDAGHMAAGPPVNADIVVVVVNYRTPELTKRCLASLSRERATLPEIRVVVVDGDSGDGSADVLELAISSDEYAGWVSFLPLAINGGYGWANNQAILTIARESRLPDYVYTLNPDAEVTSGAISVLVDELERHPRCAAVGSRVVTPDGQPAASAFHFPSAGREFVTAASAHRLRLLLGISPSSFDPSASCEVDWVTGASVMFRTAALRETGLFDDGFFLYFEEVELMHRLRRAGWAVRFAPESRIVHAEGSATGLGSGATHTPPAYWYESRRRYFALTGGRAAVVTAGVAALSGRAIASLKALFGKPRDNVARTNELIRLGLWPRPRDRRPSTPHLGDLPGQPPAWMSRQ